MQSVLIANRGEIAVRIIRACREVGLRSIAVCSEPDSNALHVRLADSYCMIGPAPAAQSYLSIPAILAAARMSGADAVHPGYGFLSERADFAAACAEAGLVFIGPQAEVIHALGDKIAARSAMEAVGVPVTPGYGGASQNDKDLLSAAKRIGFPVIIKAAAGGGGRGMRVVSEPAHFPEFLAEARREAVAAFGDERVLIERYIQNSRHVEFQIFGDAHGGRVHLFERDCSIQRRHQKIIEESPCPALSGELRDRMAASALLVANTAGYTNAGTVEFLLEVNPEGAGKFYFMEVNTRLQVEHPVTEMVTGIDLVQLQLRTAAKSPLPFKQEQISQRGHCIEVRIYAESPSNSFLPSVGKLHRWIEPRGVGIRVDSGVTEGDSVAPYYDPMLAKLIVHAETREQALHRLRTALDEFCVLGIDTNIPYLQAIVDNAVFRSGEATTRLLAESFSAWSLSEHIPEPVLCALAANALEPALSHGRSGTARVGPRAVSPWHAANAWRNS